MEHQIYTNFRAVFESPEQAKARIEKLRLEEEVDSDNGKFMGKQKRKASQVVFVPKLRKFPFNVDQIFAETDFGKPAFVRENQSDEELIKPVKSQ